MTMFFTPCSLECLELKEGTSGSLVTGRETEKSRANFPTHFSPSCTKKKF